MAPPKSGKKTLGRRKIDMKYVEDVNARTVTFSKRRVGLFKKATELSVMCGAQIALIIFTMCGRAYAYGHPTVNSVMNRFLNKSHVPTLQDSAEGRMVRAKTIQELTEKCDQAKEELEKAKKKVQELEAVLEDSPFQTSEEALSRLDVNQLKDLKKTMESLRENVQFRVETEKSKNVQEKVAFDLSNVGREDSPIPPDWLKL